MENTRLNDARLDMSFIPVNRCSDDIEKLSAFASSVVKEHFDRIIGSEQNDYMIKKFQSADAIKKQLTDGCEYYWVIRNDEKVGFLAFYPDASMRHSDNNDKKDTGKMYLSKFYLKKESRGQGIAREMFSFIKEKARDIKARSIFLNVNRNNTDVIAVYKHLGFVISGQEKNDIGEGFYMDDYVMEYRREDI